MHAFDSEALPEGPPQLVRSISGEVPEFKTELTSENEKPREGTVPRAVVDFLVANCDIPFDALACLWEESLKDTHEFMMRVARMTCKSSVTGFAEQTKQSLLRCPYCYCNLPGAHGKLPVIDEDTRPARI